MSAGAKKDYGFGQKEHWGRWYANRVVERLECTPRAARVAGLFGSDLRDLPRLERRGFRRENFWGVEKDPEACAQARAAGVSVVNSEVNDFLASWDGEPFDVIVLDFCGGASWTNLETAVLLANSWACTKGTVIVVNMLRGREQSRAMRLRRAMMTGAGMPDLSRPELFFSTYARSALQNSELWPEITDAFLCRFNDAANLVQSSYRSQHHDGAGAGVFESAVFTLPIVKRHLLDSKKMRAKWLRVRKQITALRAHRTRRGAA